MAAPFLLVLLLIASAGTAAVGDDGAMLPHLELPGTPDSRHGHRSDAPPPQGLMGILSTGGCGSFAGLLAATPNASDIFQERIKVAGGGGLTVFCPDDKAVAAFDPTFRALADHDRLDVLLHHGAAARYDRAQLAAFEWVAVRTLAATDAATNRSQSITVRDDGNTVWVWPSPTSCQGGCAARVVVETVSSEEGPLAVYLVDAVLLPGHLRQKVGNGGYLVLGWLNYCVPLWGGLSWVAAAIVGTLVGAWCASLLDHRGCSVIDALKAKGEEK